MSVTAEDRDARLSLAKQKLKKFQKKKASTQTGADHSDTGSIPGSVSEVMEDFSGRSSPSFQFPAGDSAAQAFLGENPLPHADALSQLSGSATSANGFHNRTNFHPAYSRSSTVEVTRREDDGRTDDGQEPTSDNSLRTPSRLPKSGSFAGSDSGGLAVSSTLLNQKISPARSTSSHGSCDESDRQSLKRTLAELMEANQRLKYDLDMERNSTESRILREHQSLREQLNGHIQSIGILVAEKTELQAAVTQADYIAKKKAAEADGYAARLSELHRRMAEYERRQGETNFTGQQQLENYQESYSLQMAQLNELRQHNENLERNSEQTRDELLELRKKLNLKDMETRKLVQRSTDLESRLASFTSRRTNSEQQLSGLDVGTQEQVDVLTRDKKFLESRLLEYQTELSTLKRDMNEMGSRYQNLVAQVNSARDKKTDVGGLEAKVADLDSANQQLKHQLDELQREKDGALAQATRYSDSSLELRQRHALLESSLQEKAVENESVLTTLKQQEQELTSLRTFSTEHRNSVTERENLLASVESDKIALSRAMSQNNELKALLDQLTDELEREKQEVFRYRGEAEKLSSLAETAFGMKALASPGVSTSQSQTDLQMSLESVPPASPTVNQKAFEVKIRNLEDEIQMFKNRVVQADSEVIYLKNALRIKEEEAKLLDLTERVGAYRTLEHKFVTSMKQNAELQDQVDQLEHIIMQLQGETETIGDYIALYQNQRSLQKQREHEKDLQIERLSREREHLVTKITQLVVYVKSNLGMNKALPKPVHSHMEMVQTGDVPDTPVVAAALVLQNGEYLREEVKETDPPLLEAHGVASTENPSAPDSIPNDSGIVSLVQDIDSFLRKDASETTSRSHLPGHPLYCRCCVGVLKVV